MYNVFFVIGVNGVGKTTTCNFLKDKFPASRFSVYDFDERGVPDSTDKEWRKSETEYWLNLGIENKKLNKNTVICGFMKPVEIEEITEKLGDRPVVILLDAEADTISERIKSRYLNESSIKELFRATNKSVEKFIEDNVYYSNILRESCLLNNYKIIETTKNDPAKVAKEVSDFILNFKEEI